MASDNNNLYKTFSIPIIIAAAFICITASAQTSALTENKNIPKNDIQTLYNGENKSSGKEPEKKGTATIKTKNQTIPDDKEKSTVKAPDKTGTDKSKKNTDPGKDTKNPEVWDDTKKAEKIESTLEYGMQKDRKTAIIMINDIKDEQIKNRLMQKLVFIIENDSDIEIKKAAVTAIGDNKSVSSTQALIKALDDPSDDIKIAACYAIGKINADAAKPKLVELFRKQDLKLDSNLTDAIIMTLYNIKAPDIIDIAVTAGKDSSTSKIVRERLIIYIGYTGSAVQKVFLTEIYKNDDEETTLRSYAIKSIAKLKIKDASQDIKNVIKEIDSYPFGKRKKYYDLYMYSVAALVELGDTDSISLLMNPLRSDNASVRLKAVNLIKEFNDERTIDILKYKMKNDPSAKVRKAARKSLEEKGLIEKGKSEENTKNDGDKEDNDE